jgi:hypothetical protein
LLLDRISLSGRNILDAIQPTGGVLLLLYAIASIYGCSADKPDYEVLFGSENTSLSPEDKTAIFVAFAEVFPLSGDGKQLEDPNCGDIAPTTEIADLNGDGVNEVFVQWGNACTSGMTGRSLSLFAKDGSGDYQQQLGFPALGWTTLDSSEQGWPNLKFGGPGFCHAVWAWTANGYAFKCNLPETSGGCDSRGKVCLNVGNGT